MIAENKCWKANTDDFSFANGVSIKLGNVESFLMFDYFCLQKFSFRNSTLQFDMLESTSMHSEFQVAFETKDSFVLANSTYNSFGLFDGEKPKYDLHFENWEERRGILRKTMKTVCKANEDFQSGFEGYIQIF